MCEAVGHPVVRLSRVAFGPLTLDGLSEGQARRLTDRGGGLCRGGRRGAHGRQRRRNCQAFGQPGQDGAVTGADRGVVGPHHPEILRVQRDDARGQCPQHARVGDVIGRLFVAVGVALRRRTHSGVGRLVSRYRRRDHRRLHVDPARQPVQRRVEPGDARGRTERSGPEPACRGHGGVDYRRAGRSVMTGTDCGPGRLVSQHRGYPGPRLE